MIWSHDSSVFFADVSGSRPSTRVPNSLGQEPSDQAPPQEGLHQRGRGDGERNDAPIWKWMDDIATWSAGDQHHWYQCGYIVCEATIFSMWHLSSTGHFLSFVDVMRHLRWTNDFAPHVGDMLEWATCFQSVQTVVRVTVGLWINFQRIFGMLFELSTDRVEDVQWNGAQNGRISERAGQSSSSSSCRSHATTFLFFRCSCRCPQDDHRSSFKSCQVRWFS